MTDRLHEGRSVAVQRHQIATAVSGWLAELGANSPLVPISHEPSAPVIGPLPTSSVSICRSRSTSLHNTVAAALALRLEPGGTAENCSSRSRTPARLAIDLGVQPAGQHPHLSADCGECPFLKGPMSPVSDMS